MIYYVLNFIGLTIFCYFYTFQGVESAGSGVKWLGARNGPDDGSLFFNLSIIGIREDLPKGSVVGTLQAIDPDGTPIEYGIESKLVEVDKNTGRVTTIALLDREEKSEQYTEIVVFAYEVIDPTDIVRSRYDIHLLDVNDNRPEFHNVPYLASVPENTTVGSIIFNQISITDKDLTHNAQIDIACIATENDPRSTEGCASIRIDLTRQAMGVYTGNVVLMKPLNYESLSEFLVTLRATDRGSGKRLSRDQNMAVDILDVQDTPPILNINPISVREDVAVLGQGTVIGSFSGRDQDSGNPHYLKVSLENDFNGIFALADTPTIDPARNHIYDVLLKKPLDYEKVKSYSMQVLAQELESQNGPIFKGQNSTATARLLVFVTDVNDNGPKFFQNQQTKVIDENLPKDSIITIGGIDDADSREYAKMKISLQNNIYGTFSVQPTEVNKLGNLALVVQKPETLDYEDPKLRKQEILVVATELASYSPRHTSTATVTIVLSDINDNIPKFAQDTYERKVSENRPVGTSIAQITATDGDALDAGKLKYELEGDSRLEFSIDSSTGEIKLVKPLDYETNNFISLNIVATDTKGQSASARLIVNVTNFNDKAPRFESDQFNTFMLERTTVLKPEITVKAVDDEVDTRITYWIKSGNPTPDAFAVGQTSGIVSVIRPNVVFSEAPLGRFKLVIGASDNGLPQAYTSEVTIFIQVEDTNDFSPVFDPKSYLAYVAEIAPGGTSVLKVTATDQDKAPYTKNGDITYSITTGSKDQFEIDPLSGVISIASSAVLDIESTGDRYTIKVEAADKGSPSLTGTADVTILVNDSNNKVPTFTKDLYSFDIPRNAKRGTMIGKVAATDPDSNKQLQYSIASSSFRAFLANGIDTTVIGLYSQVTIDRNNGVISVPLNKDMDTLQAKYFTFNVECQDLLAEVPSIQITSSRVTVNLYDVTGTDPFFQKPWSPANPVLSFTISEEEAVGTKIFQLIAKDPLSTNPDELSLDKLTIVGDSNKDGIFTLSKNGQVTINKRIDYDSMVGEKTYNLVVKAETNQLPLRSSTCTLMVVVNDINDNSPIFFKADGYSFSIPESVRFPYVIGLAQASDRDSAAYGEIRYSISGQGSEMFTISRLGQINPADGKQLDFETRRLYSLMVTAYDNPTKRGTSESRSTSVPLIISLTDRNDMKPNFDKSVYYFYAMETTKKGTSLGLVFAKDDDSERNGEVNYFIRLGNDKGLFSLDQSTGVLSSNINLDGHAQSAPYILTVQAQDKGLPMLYSDVTVNVFVQDLSVYDGKPKFQTPYDGQIIKVPENQPPGLVVVTAKAIIRTQGQQINADIRYFLDNPDAVAFTIDPVTGILKTAVTFDRERKSVYKIKIGATRLPENLVSFILLDVVVTDFNDNEISFYNCPVLLKSPVTTTIPENKEKGYFVAKILACDFDISPNNFIYYYITCGNERNHFTVGLRTGIITTTGPIDREVQSVYDLCIYATNTSTLDPNAVDTRPKRDALNPKAIQLIVNIDDEDDNGPKYADRMTTGILVTIPYDTAFFSAAATDNDIQIHSINYYDISASVFVDEDGRSDVPNAFSINKNTGMLHTVKDNFMPYLNGHFELTVRSWDNYGRTATTQVWVYILNQGQYLQLIYNGVPKDAEKILGQFTKELDIAVQSIISTNEVRYHINTGDLRFNFAQSDVCYIHTKGNKILNAAQSQKLLEVSSLTPLFEKYKFKQQVGLCTVGNKTYQYWGYVSVWWIMIALAAVLILFGFIMIIVVLCLWRRYVAYMEGVRTWIVVETPGEEPQIVEATRRYKQAFKKPTEIRANTKM